MVKKKTPNRLYWDNQAKNQVRDEYEQWLSDKDMESSPHHAHLFAMEVLAGGHKYWGMTERDMIIFLAGALPEMYD